MGLFFSSPTSALTSSVGTNALVSCLSSSPATSLALVNANRKGLTLTNLGNRTVFVGFSDTVTATSYAIALTVGSIYEFPVAFTGALFAIAQSGTQPVNVVELS